MEGGMGKCQSSQIVGMRDLWMRSVHITCTSVTEQCRLLEDIESEPLIEDRRETYFFDYLPQDVNR